MRDELQSLLFSYQRNEMGVSEYLDRIMELVEKDRVTDPLTRAMYKEMSERHEAIYRENLRLKSALHKLQAEDECSECKGKGTVLGFPKDTVCPKCKGIAIKRIPTVEEYNIMMGMIFNQEGWFIQLPSGTKIAKKGD